MSSDFENGTPAPEPEEEQEITARFSRDELVRSWRERDTRVPRVVPVLRFAVKTDLGRIRENNEDKSDFYEPEDPTLLACRGCFYAVADGMGGHAAGQIASELGLKTTISSYYDNPNDDIPSSLLESIGAANELVHNVSLMVPDRKGMGTTLTAAVFAEDRVFVAQVGDSRAYLVRNGSIRQVTFDHSWVAEQVRAGALTEEEAESSPYRNVITRALGTMELIEPEVFIEEARPGDVWILCSDGLTGHVQDDEIRTIASSQPPSEAARQLIELANSRGGRDNITVFVVAVRDLIPCESSSSSFSDSASLPSEATPEKRGFKRLFGK